MGSESSPTEFLAFCTGLLPAAAAVAARDTSELFKFGIEIISITFRMAFEIGRRMKLTEDSDGSWAVTIVGTTVEKTQAILDDFHSSQVWRSLYGRFFLHTADYYRTFLNQED